MLIITTRIDIWEKYLMSGNPLLCPDPSVAPVPILRIKPNENTLKEYIKKFFTF